MNPISNISPFKPFAFDNESDPFESFRSHCEAFFKETVTGRTENPLGVYRLLEQYHVGERYEEDDGPELDLHVQQATINYFLLNTLGDSVSLCHGTYGTGMDTRGTYYQSVAQRRVNMKTKMGPLETVSFGIPVDPYDEKRVIPGSEEFKQSSNWFINCGFEKGLENPINYAFQIQDESKAHEGKPWMYMTKYSIPHDGRDRFAEQLALSHSGGSKFDSAALKTVEELYNPVKINIDIEAVALQNKKSIVSRMPGYNVGVFYKADNLAYGVYTTRAGRFALIKIEGGAGSTRRSLVTNDEEAEKIFDWAQQWAPEQEAHNQLKV